MSGSTTGAREAISQRLDNYARRIVADAVAGAALDFLQTLVFMPWVIGVCLVVAGILSPYWHIYAECNAGLWSWYRNNKPCLDKWKSHNTDLIIWTQIYVFLGSGLSALCVITSLIAVFASDSNVKSFHQAIAWACCLFDGPLILSGCIIFWVQSEVKREVGTSYWITLIGGVLHIPLGLVCVYALISARQTETELSWDNHSGLRIKYQGQAWGLVLWSFSSTDLMRWVQFYEFSGSVISAFSVITSTASAFANERADKNFHKAIACVCSMFDGPFILAGCIVFYLQLEDGRQADASFWFTCIAGILHIPRGKVGLNKLSAIRRPNRERPHEN